MHAPEVSGSRRHVDGRATAVPLGSTNHPEAESSFSLPDGESGQMDALIAKFLSKMAAESAAGPDGISPHFIKFARVKSEDGNTFVHLLSPYLRSLFATMMREGKVSECCEAGKTEFLAQEGGGHQPRELPRDCSQQVHVSSVCQCSVLPAD